MKEREDIHIIGDEKMRSYVYRKNHLAAAVVQDGKLRIEDGGPYPITYSSIGDYIKLGLPPNIMSRTDTKVLEIGVGLSEFLPRFAVKAKYRPVVIGPDNYPVMMILCEAVTQCSQESSEIRNLAAELAERAMIMMSDRVELINTTFDETMKSLQDRIGQFDVVINVASSGYYSQVGIRDAVSFLRPGGIYIPIYDSPLIPEA